MSDQPRRAVRVVHPLHGIHEPRVVMPVRRPVSVRRTTTIDTTRPDGLLSYALMTGRGRDLFTDGHGDGHEISTALMNVRLAAGFERVVESLAVEPSVPVDRLVGARASTGFRAALDEALPGERAQNSLRYQLLDDLPTAALVSGYAIGAADVERPQVTPDSGAAGDAMVRGDLDGINRVDLCSGWAHDATMLSVRAQGGHPHSTGPVAPRLQSATDPHAWHEFGPLGPHDMRRARSIDVWHARDSVFGIENYFRDSHVDADLVETIVHEYTILAEYDAERGVFTAANARAHTLPWGECIRAEASAQRVVTMSAKSLRSAVRAEFTGVTTCTHLNDTLRLLEDVPGLVASLGRSGQSS